MPQSAQPFLTSVRLHDLSPHEFSAMTEPHRRELRVHCYRMLGSLQDAEDLVQETLLRAWQRHAQYAGRAPLRAWLYKIATNLCLDTLKHRARRTLPSARQGVATLDEPIPRSLNEPIWLEPFPDALRAPEASNPAARFAAQESVTLAFVLLLQVLPPRQRAVLILRDVLDWPASEVADLLDLTIPAVKSALFRARTTVATHIHQIDVEQVAPSLLEESTRLLLEQYVKAWEQADPNELVVLLKADATFSMPPIPAWYRGRATIRTLVTRTIFGGAANGRWRLLPTRANGQFAFGLYRRNDEDANYHAYGIQTIRITAGEIADILTFQNPSLAAYFALPLTLTGASVARDDQTPLEALGTTQ